MHTDVSPVNRLLLGSAGLVALLVAWEIAGRVFGGEYTWPALSTILVMLGDEAQQPVFGRAVLATLQSTGMGYVIGISTGLALAVTSHLLPILKPGSDRLAAVVNSVPPIALAPIFLLMLSRETTPGAVASIHVFFIVYVSMTSGLLSASQAHHDLFTALGATSRSRFRLLELPAALPALVSGLRLAWPAALIGAIIGEWFGAPRGIGILIINAMQNFQIVLLWSAVLLAVVTSLVFYGLLTLLERATYRHIR